ncbi:MAG: DUF4240 domain-containing protein, partial [Muribaculaceae bacterium]|nr:DUF4240 domain-containing protein [Muribaculaceae bacterium]
MKKDASKLMSEDRFWEIIDNSDQGNGLDMLLANFSDNELIGFSSWWDHFTSRLYRQDLWAVAYVVRGGCSDDSFDYFRYWLMAQGRKVVNDALENADSLCDVFEQIEKDGYEVDPQNEDLNYIVFETIENRTSLNPNFRNELEEYEIPSSSAPEMDFEWEEDDPESIRKICPRTFAFYYDDPI